MSVLFKDDMCKESHASRALFLTRSNDKVESRSVFISPFFSSAPSLHPPHSHTFYINFLAFPLQLVAVTYQATRLSNNNYNYKNNNNNNNNGNHNNKESTSLCFGSQSLQHCKCTELQVWAIKRLINLRQIDSRLIVNWYQQVSERRHCKTREGKDNCPY